MEHRVERAGADAIAMPRKFLDHLVPIQVALGGVMQDVKPYKFGQKLLMLHMVIFPNRPHYRISISGTDCIWHLSPCKRIGLAEVRPTL